MPSINIKRTPAKFQAVANLDSELDAIIKQINAGFENISKTMNSSVTWLSGAGVPNKNLGTDGNLYLDETTKSIYKKVNGSWL